MNLICRLKKAYYSTKSQPKAAPGFSFLELILVVGIIGALSLAILNQIQSYQKRSNIGLAKGGLRRLSGAIDFYHTDTDQYPTTLTDLIKRPADVKNWTEGYITKKDELVDPWSNKYQYAPTPDAEHPYQLFSYGPKGKKGSKEERISVWDAK